MQCEESFLRGDGLTLLTKCIIEEILSNEGNAGIKDAAASMDLDFRWSMVHGRRRLQY